MELSLSLLKSKKAVYNKFNNNLCVNVSTNYQPTEVNLKEMEGSMKLEGNFMGAMCRYIEIMGKMRKEFLKETWKFYLV